MASVTSLDQDMKRLRMSRYTASAINELRTWIEETLGERLAGEDVLERLRDGIVLCRLVNLALPSPGIKYKKSQMPFIQMENIAQFLRACEDAPFRLPSHDRFLTVDLYELKDPAQVVQCLGAFSRVAHSLFPAKFPHTIGPKRATAMSPTHTGASNSAATYHHARGVSKGQSNSPANSAAATGGLTGSAFTGASSILYSGYSGGASQGNQGISFGGRRQITTPAPYVPTLAEKERKRKDKQAEDERRTAAAEEAEAKRQMQQEAEDERQRTREEARWEEETRCLREQEKQKVQDQKREWDEQERRWKQAEQDRIRGETEAQSQAHTETQRRRGLSDPRLRGQYLSDYHKEERAKPRQDGEPVGLDEAQQSGERERIQELERQLEEAKAREKQYQEERFRRNEGRQAPETDLRSTSRPLHAVANCYKIGAARDASPQDSNVSWTPDDREYLRHAGGEDENSLVAHRQHDMTSARTISPPSTRPLPDPAASQRRPLPEPSANKPVARPLPDPVAYASSPSTNINRTDRFLNHHQALPQVPHTFVPAESLGSSAFEQRAEDDRREASQHQTKAGGRASKSLLEREMERERERQREWEHSQKETQNAARDHHAGAAAGQSWDVNQYGYMGGDSQNRGGNGIGFGAKRQILGPRPPP